jgi:hypothetical protein
MAAVFGPSAFPETIALHGRLAMLGHEARPGAMPQACSLAASGNYGGLCEGERTAIGVVDGWFVNAPSGARDLGRSWSLGARRALLGVERGAR